jgi:hypothetical protein
VSQPPTAPPPAPAPGPAPAKDQVKEKDDGINLAQLTGLGAAATTLIAIISALAVTGVLQRTQRNEGTLLGAAFICAIAAAAAWVAISIAKPSTWRSINRYGTWAETGIKATAPIAFAAGIVLAILAVIQTQKLTQRPTIDARINPGPTLEATVKASGLTADSRIVIYVDGLQEERSKPGSYGPPRTIYQAYLGPDPDGDIKVPVNLTIPASQYDAVGLRAWTTLQQPPCEFTDIDPKTTGTRLGAACVILPLFRAPTRPQLSIKWGPNSDSGRELNLTVTSANSPRNRLFLVRVIATGQGRRLELARQLGEADNSGSTKTESTLTVPKGMRTVCAEARFIDAEKTVPRMRCPNYHRGPAAAVAQLAVPW